MVIVYCHPMRLERCELLFEYSGDVEVRSGEFPLEEIELHVDGKRIRMRMYDNTFGGGTKIRG